MKTHTPGPWTVHGITITHESDGCEYPIASCTDTPIGFEEATANARLIAAAPELLDAAKAAITRFKEDGIGGYHMLHPVALLVNAVAKAEGKGTDQE